VPARSGSGPLEVRTTSSEETRALGEALGRVLLAARARGEVAALAGPLGAGKTTFVQGLARGLGAGGYVRSPTFVLVHHYPGPLPLYHVDLYRIGQADLDTLGLEEIMESDGVTAIEWAPTAAALLPDDHLSIELAFDGDAARETRVIRLAARGERSRRILDDLAACRRSSR
jgi:tRNA threonylcarbamoyladenosine biosynthesis protein TsaE